MAKLLCLLLVLMLNVAVAQAAPTKVEVQALFTGGAVLTINGQRKTLRIGDSYDGVVLLEVDSKGAILELNGELQAVTVSSHIGSNYQTPERRQISITRDIQLQYQTAAIINGKRTQVLVDTGANAVAMNSSHAASLGLDYLSGDQVQVDTASGVTPAWRVTLDSVDVGGIRVDKVVAIVMEGTHPTTILLGMTYLRHVDMSESGGVLSLSAQW